MLWLCIQFPQLPLEAVIAQTGGFKGVPAGEASELAFWRMAGGDPPGEIKPIDDPARHAEEDHISLLRLFEQR